MKALYKVLLVLLCSVILATCGSIYPSDAAVTLEKESFGETPEGTPVTLYRLMNENGIEVALTNYEGIVLSVMVPDEDGKKADVVLGYDTLDEYIARDPYFGGIREGGSQRLNGIVWETEEFINDDGAGVIMSTESMTQEDKTLFVTVTYTLTVNNELKIEYAATTNAETVVDLNNDIYFNLAGEGAKSVLDHELLLNAESYYPISDTLQPIYELQPVRGTPMNYTRSRAIRTTMEQQTEQIRLRRGYQHIWQVEKEAPDALEMAARIYEPESKRVLEVQTTTQGLFFATGNFLDREIKGKGQKTYERYAGFTISAREISISEARVEFPAIPLLPDQAYSYMIVYKFFSL